MTGDLNAKKVLDCIAFSAILYGEQIILIQCLPNIMDLVTNSSSYASFSLSSMEKIVQWAYNPVYERM